MRGFVDATFDSAPVQGAQGALARLVFEMRPAREWIAGLDGLMLSLALATGALAVRRGHGRLYGLLVLLGLGIELASIHLGKTHCHAASSIANFGKCSSVNSVLFYGPWLYLPLLCAPLLSGSVASATALLQMLFGLVYELQGPSNGWWLFGDDLIHNGAFAGRILGAPLVAILFHPVLGFGIASMMRLVGVGMHEAPKNHTFGRLMLVVILTLPFVAGSDLLLHVGLRMGAEKSFSVAAITFLCFVLPILASTSRPIVPRSSAVDGMLIALISFVWYAFFVLQALWHLSYQPDILLLLFTITVAGLVLFGKSAWILMASPGKK